MNTKLMKPLLGRPALAALLVSTFTPLLASGAGKIEGAWNVTATILSSCTMGQPVWLVYGCLPLRTTESQETAAFFNPLTPALRSPGQGVWRHLTNGNYSYDVQFFPLQCRLHSCGVE